MDTGISSLDGLFLFNIVEPETEEDDGVDKRDPDVGFCSRIRKGEDGEEGDGEAGEEEEGLR